MATPVARRERPCLSLSDRLYNGPYRPIVEAIDPPVDVRKILRLSFVVAQPDRRAAVKSIFS